MKVAYNLLLGVVCGVMATAAFVPQAHAARLTDTQVRAILGLLYAFEVDPPTISHVSDILYGNTTSADIPLVTIDPFAVLTDQGAVTIGGTASNVYGKTFNAGMYQLVGNIKQNYHGGNSVTQADGRWDMTFQNVQPGTYTVEILIDGNTMLKRSVVVSNK